MKLKLIGFLLFITSNLFAQEINKEKIDTYINYVENNNGGIGSVSIFKNGVEVYNRSFGQNKLVDVVYDKNTTYQVASVTKMVTAILVLKLVEDGRLKLDDRLSGFYPEITNSDKITIKNLLEHSSGLGNFAIKNGSIWITEKKYKKAYHKIVTQAITKPLKLKDFASVNSNPTNIFKSYKFLDGWKEIKDIEYTNVIGVGDIASTTKNLNILINSLFKYKILKKETLELMKPLKGVEEWGRGMALFSYGDHVFYGHSGDVLGSHSRLIYNPEDKVSVAYSTNGERIPANVFIEDLVSILYNNPYVFPQIK